MADKFDLQGNCEAASEKSFKLLHEIVEKTTISMNQGGENLALMNLGFKAAGVILAYGHGQPTSRVEHSGQLDHNVTVDPKKMSTEALRELLAARQQKALPE